MKHFQEEYSRSITSPEKEPSERGPQESFVEALAFNIALIKRKIKSDRLKIESFTIGDISNTEIALLYIEGIVDDKLIVEIKNRLEGIDVDAVLDSGYIEELIEDNPWSLFPTVNHTERPDRVAAMLLEGRAAIIADGSPNVLTVPNLFIEYFQAPGDYYERFLFAAAFRLIRLIAMITALILPSIYIAVLNFHQEMLPGPLIFNFAASREVLPFPILLEVIIVEVIFDVLKEIGRRLPWPVGQTAGILGGLLLGGIAVWARLFAPATIFIVVFAGIASFSIANSARITLHLTRFALLLLSGALGLLGLLGGVTLLVIHMCTLRSFGIPYLSPMAPTTGGTLNDTVIRAPWWAMISRPRSIAGRNKIRQGLGLKPTAHKE